MQLKKKSAKRPQQQQQQLQQQKQQQHQQRQHHHLPQIGRSITNSHDCEKLRSEANSHKIDSTFASQFLKRVRFRNWNRLRIRRAKSVKNSLLSQYFYRFLRAQLQCTASDILNMNNFE
jgi:hypothetical protein